MVVEERGSGFFQKGFLILWRRGGFGKTTLLEKFIEEAKDVAKLHKEELVALKINWDSYHREKSTLPNTGEKMLHAIFETITTLHKKGNFPKYVATRNKAKEAQEKAEKESQNLFDSESMKKMGMTAIGLVDVATDYIPMTTGIKKTVQNVASAMPESAKTVFFESAIAAGDYIQKAILEKLKARKSLSEEEYALCLDGGESVLSRAFVEDFVALCQKKTIILTIDTYELVDEKDLDKWLRESLLKEIYSHENIKCITILAGRNDHSKTYRNSISKVLDYTDFEKLLFTEIEVALFAKKENLELTESEIKIIAESTKGIPLAVRDILFHFRNYISRKEEILKDIESHKGTFQEILDTVSKRFLQYCLEEPITQKRVFQLCMLLESKWELDLLISLWEMKEEEIRLTLEEMSRKHSFLKSGDWTIHKTVLEFMRNYMQMELDPNKNSIYRNGILHSAERMSEFYAAKIKLIEEEFPEYEERYAEENYRKILKQYLNTLLWKDKKEFFKVFQGYFLECLFFAKDFAREVIEEANCFKNSFSSKEKNLLKILEAGLGKYQIYYDYTEYIKPRANELKNLVETLKKENHFTEFQKALLEFLEANALASENKIDHAYQKLNLNYGLLTNIKKETSITYFMLGYYFLDSNLTEEAKDCYLKAIELDPEFTNAYFNLGIGHSDLKNYEEAIRCYIKAIELDPEFTNAYFNLGNVYSDLKNYEEAIRCYTKSIELDSKFPNAYNGLGLVYSEQKNYEEAIRCYTKSIELDSKFPNAYNGLGNVYSDLKNYEEAIRCYSKIIEIDSKFPNAYNGLGNVYSDLKNYEEAIRCYAKAIELDPKFLNAYNGLGIVYQNQNSYEGAIRCYTKAIEIDPKFPNAYNGLGNVYSDLKNYEEAIRYYTKAIEIDPKYFYAYFNLGLVHLNLKNYSEQIRCYIKAIELDSKFPNAYNGLGLVYSEQKNYEEAIRYYTKSIEIDSTDANIISNLSQILFITGKMTEAIEAIKKAFALNPTDIDLLAELWFYVYAHIPERREEAEIKLNRLVANGAKSEGWNFSANIEKAIADGHPDQGKLQEFSERISGSN